MKKILFALLAFSLCAVGCEKNSDESEEIELVSKITLDGKSYDVTDVSASYNTKAGSYSLSSCVTLDDGFSTVFMAYFDDSLIGKSFDAAKKSDSDFMFIMNGFLPYKDEILYGGEVYIRNQGGDFSSGFKSGTVTAAKQGDNVSIKIEGTLNMGASFSYQTFIALSAVEKF